LFVLLLIQSDLLEIRNLEKISKKENRKNQMPNDFEDASLNMMNSLKVTKSVRE
jgi:hypothetical protein